jgi:Ca2+-binding RTX toxin-like protein
VGLAERLLGSPDIDLILGTHVHVVQPIARVNGEVVVYGMGNQISNMMEGCCGHAGTQDGVMVHLTVIESGGRFVATDVRYTPTWVHPVTKAVTPVAHALATGPGDFRAGLEASLARSLDRVTMLGAAGIRLSLAPWPVLSCGGSPATIVGTNGDDVLQGTPDDDVIVGRGGGDTVLAGEGDDLVCGGDGDDILLAGGGDDEAYGDGGDDRLDGGEGDDLLDGGSGRDTLDGRRGEDRLRGGDGADALRGGSGNDALDGQGGEDLLAAGAGGDILQGGSGRDLLIASPGEDALHSDGADFCRSGAAPLPCAGP